MRPKEFLRRRAAAGLRLALRLASGPLPRLGPTVVIAPHPDDETLGCGGLIAAQARSGQPARVVFLTRGEASHRGHPAEAALELPRLRRSEAEAALSALGHPAGQAEFWELPDGGLDRLSPAGVRAAEERLAALFVRLRPEAVFVPYRRGGSTEHTAAWQLAAGAAARAGGGLLYEYPVWGWWNAFRLAPRLRRASGNFRLSLGPLAGLKRAALACHRSQVEPTPPWSEPRLPPSLASACCGPEEFFFATRIGAGQVDPKDG